MMKTEVYSWRLSPDLKAALEEAAREEQTSVADLLDRIARGWLDERISTTADSAAEQERLQTTAMHFAGALTGGDNRRAETSRQRIRERLGKRYAR